MFATAVWLIPMILLQGIALLLVFTANRFVWIHAPSYRVRDHANSHGQVVNRPLISRAWPHCDEPTDYLIEGTERCRDERGFIFLSATLLWVDQSCCPEVDRSVCHAPLRSVHIVNIDEFNDRNAFPP